MNAVQIGISKQSVEAVQKTIMAILNSKACDHLKETALEVLPKLASVDHAMIANCHITATETGVKVRRKTDE